MNEIQVKIVVVTETKVYPKEFHEFLARQVRQYFSTRGDGTAGIVVGPNEVNNQEDMDNVVVG